MSPSVGAPGITAPSPSMPPRNAVRLIEQRLLPHEFRIVAARISGKPPGYQDMVVRGAGRDRRHRGLWPGPGRARFRGHDLPTSPRYVDTVLQTLEAARPTAVDPVNAMYQVRASMRAGKTVAEQQRSPSRPPRNLPARMCAIARQLAARREADSERHEDFDPLQRRLAGVCGRGFRHRADVCRAGAG